MVCFSTIKWISYQTNLPGFLGGSEVTEIKLFVQCLAQGKYSSNGLISVLSQGNPPSSQCSDMSLSGSWNHTHTHTHTHFRVPSVSTTPPCQLLHYSHFSFCTLDYSYLSQKLDSRIRIQAGKELRCSPILPTFSWLVAILECFW